MLNTILLADDSFAGKEEKGLQKLVSEFNTAYERRQLVNVGTSKYVFLRRKKVK